MSAQSHIVDGGITLTCACSDTAALTKDELYVRINRIEPELYTKVIAIIGHTADFANDGMEKLLKKCLNKN